MSHLQRLASLFLPLPLQVAAEIRHLRFLQRDPLACQRELLTRLIQRAAATRFGRDHRFPDLLGLSFDELYRQYSRAVPIRTYQQYWEQYFEPHLHANGTKRNLQLRDVSWPGDIPYFCETSGTTAPTKFIPFTKEMFSANRRAAIDMLAAYLANRPGSRVAGGKFLYMAGSTDLADLGGGILSGDMSAITLKERPRMLEPFVEPKEPLSSAPWEERLDGMARLLLMDEQIHVVSGVPPWLLLLFKRCEELSGVRVQDALPHLDLVIHGGASLAPYRDEFLRLFPDRQPDFLEVLPSSEAFMGFQVQGESVMRLTPWYGAFFEFVPFEQLDESGVPRTDADTVTLEQVVSGQRYAVILSTCAGLWRYHIGDTLRFLDTEQYRIEFTGRDKFLDRFEEKVTQAEVEGAVAALNAELGGGVREFMVGPDIAGRRHLWVLACRGNGPDTQQAARFLDCFLQEANADYATFRNQGRINLPSVLVGDEERIYRWSRDERGKLGGQSKIPHIDPTVRGELIASLAGQIRDSHPAFSNP